MIFAIAPVILFLFAAGPHEPSIDSLFAEALRASPTPARVREQHRYWIGDGANPADDGYRERLQAGLAADRKAAAFRVDPDALGAACLDLRLDQGCGVEQVGFLNDAPGGGRLYWQIQQGASGEDGVGGGIVLLRQDGDCLRPILWDFEAWRYEAPVWITDEDGASLLVLRALSRGTSNSPMDLLFRWDDTAWRQIDTSLWSDQVPVLADGLTVQSGVHIDYRTLRGVTPLWRPRDGGCCPSGGLAELKFEIRGDALRLVEVDRHTP
jgi:hypothetical protein